MADVSAINALECAPRASDVSKSDTRPPPRRSNAESGRTREHLTPDQIGKLRAAARRTRNPVRDECIVVTMFKHGLRVREAHELNWSQVLLDEGQMVMRRVKMHKLKAGQKPRPRKAQAPHYIEPDEAALLRKLAPSPKASGPVFTSTRDGKPLSISAIQKLIAALGRDAELPAAVQPVHAHMLRHSCAYALIDQGMPVVLLQRWLGHRQIANTMVYVETSPTAFTDWRDGQQRARRHR